MIHKNVGYQGWNSQNVCENSKQKQSDLSLRCFLGKNCSKLYSITVINNNHKKLTASLTNAADTDMAINNAKIEKR